MSYKKKKSYDDFNRRLKLLGFKSYSQYLKSTHWQRFKKEVWRRKKKKECYCCGKNGRLHIHHVRYKNLGREKLNDVVLLCNRCHEQVHQSNGLWYAVQKLRKKKRGGMNWLKRLGF